MTLEESCAYVMPFGKFKGQTIARIGANDVGLKLLDYYRGWDKLRPDVREPIEVYLSNPAIASLLNNLTD